jgi:ABC-type nitrate/sulfonate/bicarbonate transport system ATPase subunit
VKLIDRPHVQLSDVSGAARSLGGVALQLAACRWLLRERMSSWSTVVVDEPYGDLDPRHRRALSGHLVGLLRSGFMQSFVISHSPDTTNALPGRIEIVSDGGRAMARVVAA